MNSQHFKSSLLSGVATGIAALALSSPTIAQDKDGEAGGVQTIEVTGARQAYRGVFTAMETPQSEQILDLQTLEDAGALDLVTALDLSASVARQNNFGGLWNAFAVRGFVGDENLPSNYLVNGFNAGRGFSGPRDISGIEAVEVLKGPKSALLGRGEPGGTINIVTKRPQFKTAGQVRATYGRFDQVRFDGDYQTTLTDNIAIRLVGFWEDADSFRDTVETKRYGFTPSLAISLSDATQFIYELEYSDQKIPFDRGVVAVDGELGVIPTSTFLGEPGDGPLEGEVLGHQLELQHDFSENWSALVGFTYRDSSLEGFSTEPELSASRQQLLVDGETLTRQRRYRDYDADFTAFRAEVAGEFETGAFTHRVLFGGDYDKFVNDQMFMRYRAPGLSSNPTPEQLLAIDIYDPVYGQYPLPDVSPLTDRKETQEAYGFYVQDQITLSERLELRVGLRYDNFDQTIENRLANSVFENDANRVSPQAGLVYKASDTISLYASYGEGFRQLTGADVNGNGFDPNTTDAFETGVKFELNGGRLSGIATYFRINQNNILVGDPDNPFNLLAIGKARSQGFEFDLTGEIADGLNVLLSYAYVDAKTRSDVLDPNFNLPVAAGDRLINIPDHTLSAQIAKDLDIMGRPGHVGAGVLYVSDRLGETATDFELPSYTTARIFGEYSPIDRVTVGASIDNVFDEEFYTNSFSSLWVQPGAPRTWRLFVEYSF